jgi:hypothetical protein
MWSHGLEDGAPGPMPVQQVPRHSAPVLFNTFWILLSYRQLRESTRFEHHYLVRRYFSTELPNIHIYHTIGKFRSLKAQVTVNV